MAVKIDPSLKIKKRIFLVGCPRSGTTLLQSMLAAHPEICSFPESHFFSKTIKKRGLKSHIDLYILKRKKIRRLLTKIDNEQYIDNLPLFACFPITWAKGIISLFDAMALAKGFNVWVEKTPMHLYHIDLITKASPATYFLHILRKGEDVVASLYDATHKYPEEWKGAKSIDKCIERWIRDIEVSRQYISIKNHFFISYEKLLRCPENVLKNLCFKIGLDYYSQMLSYQSVASELILSGEFWKKEGPVRGQRGYKFNNIFLKRDQQYIMQKVSCIDFKCFEICE